ncbi:MAG: GAF domain-containing protein, partial [Candidatus Kuenenia stuttgartiensis]|nr:GAF domain-containing protein [Candidatus Kuenenia stuttgartiensis]
PVGHICKVIYTVNGAIRLESTRLWYFENTKEFSLLRKIGENTILKPGEDLPGKVFSSRKMEWIPDVTKDSNCIRAQHAIVKSAAIGVRGAFAFPIKEGDKILYIFEFFSRKEEKPQAIFFEVVDNLALQLGRLIERKRADERIRKLSQVVEQSPASI